MSQHFPVPLPLPAAPHQGVRVLASWFRPMAFAADGLIEAFYDPCPSPPRLQGVRVLASRFRPMAFAADGLIEAFYDPDVHCPPRGGFFVGLQFHPERMRRFQDGEVLPGGGPSSPREVFEYPECPRAYQFHPERMRRFQDGEVLPGGGPSSSCEVVEYPERPRAYQGVPVACSAEGSAAGAAFPLGLGGRQEHLWFSFLEGGPISPR
ncbi:unnamed protein product [Closterium sp. NIES-54]